MEQLLKNIFKPEFVFAIFRVTAPILFAALAAVIAEKAGVTNIGLEGIMSLAALFAVLSSFWAKSWIVGVLVSVTIGVLIALIMGVFALKLKTDIILVGIAINMFGAGGAMFLLYAFTGERGNTGSLAAPGVPNINLPFIHNTVIGRMISGHNALTYVAFLCVFLVFIFLYKTPIGLKIRAVGENSKAADSVGVSVKKIQYLALAISGFFCGLAGAYMSLYYSRVWSNGFIAGKGFIALAAQAMGQGEPLGTMISSLLFGLAYAIATKVEGMQGISSDIVNTIPYVATILGLTIYAALTIKKVKRYRAKTSAQKTEETNAQ